jgi:hypothetical protein
MNGGRPAAFSFVPTGFRRVDAGRRRDRAYPAIGPLKGLITTNMPSSA